MRQYKCKVDIYNTSKRTSILLVFDGVEFCCYLLICCFGWCGNIHARRDGSIASIAP